jgi:hypothetical protein
MADVLYPMLPRPGLSPSELVFNRRVSSVSRTHRAKWRGEGSEQSAVEDDSVLEEEASREADSIRNGSRLGNTLDERA